MREQIRLWFYSMLFMSVVLVGRSPYRRVLCYEKVNDETGRPMHKSWGNAIWFDDAVEKMGADVMRWMFAAQTPSQNLSFGYGPANEVKRNLLTVWNTCNFFVMYANLDGFEPRYEMLATGPDPAIARPLDRLTATTRRGWCARWRRSWRISPTGTYAPRGSGSGSRGTRTTSEPRTRRSGTPWCSCCAAWRR
jgi:isoleucyl-tRNA synthetase